MPCTYEFNPSLNHLEVSCWGSLTHMCILQSIEALEEAPPMAARQNEFRDFSTVSDVPLPTEQLSNLAQLMRGTYLRAGVRKRIAFLAPDEPGLRLARFMRDALGTLSLIKVEIFREREAALDFLRGDQGRDRVQESFRMG